ncbi:LacI family DNA-binding transcriptional regulator [Pedobacter sp. NJ-S-72]
MKPLSIKDIAKKANVSITTVSFILNGKAEKMRISQDMIAKVEAIIKEVGFKPNQVASKKSAYRKYEYNRIDCRGYF